ncbi:MAG: ATP-binding protein [Ferruginibacter sp.]
MVNDGKNLKILIVDDDEDDFFITSQYIKKIDSQKFDIEWCYRYEEALNHIKNEDFKIYLIDYHLGAQTGLDLIKEAIQSGWTHPFILLTGKGNHQVDIEAMQAGAVDYLIKSELDTEKLERSIRYAIERDKSTKALKANERKFRNIFERAADAAFLATKDLTFLDVNTAATELFEKSKDELLGMSLLDFLGESDQDSLKKDLEDKVDIDNKEVTSTSTSNATKYCLLSISEEQNNDGGYYQGILHDISILKKIEKAKLRLEKQGMADRLVNVLAHEVRNPLNNINLSIEQLLPDIVNTDNAVFLDIISRNSKRIEVLISELLNSSRTTSIEEKEIDLNIILDDTCIMAIDRITLKKIKLSKSYPATPSIIKGDAEKLKIAFLNIIINAIEAMEEGGELEVNIDSDKEFITLKISDNGYGIPEENISRLFEPYFTAKRNGMGLGLATTLNILQSHKAEVEVESIIGSGTTFIIIFPVIN